MQCNHGNYDTSNHSNTFNCEVLLMNLYEDTEQYSVHIYTSHKEWLKGRHSIGGSDASTFIGMNPYKTNNQLWKEKKGIVKAKEVTSEAIDHGNDLEPVLRFWFQQSYKDYDVKYQENAILQSKKHDFMLYSPDGLLFHEEKGRGIFESKTTLIQNANMLEEWNNQIPQHYYIQILHGLLVTDFDYVVLVAELRFAWNDRVEIRVYYFYREEVKEDLEFLLDKELWNWNEFYFKDKEPPLVLHL